MALQSGQGTSWLIGLPRKSGQAEVDELDWAARGTACRGARRSLRHRHGSLTDITCSKQATAASRPYQKQAATWEAGRGFKGCP